MREVKDKQHGKGKILPRFQFRGWTGDDLRVFVSSFEETKHLAQQVYDQVE